MRIEEGVIVVQLLAEKREGGYEPGKCLENTREQILPRTSRNEPKPS